MDIKFDMNEWRRIKDNLKKEYPELTDVDLDWGRVSREDLLLNISTKLGKTSKDLMEVIESF